MLKVASIDGPMPFLVACHCTVLIVNLLFVICTWQINFFLSLSLSLWCSGTTNLLEGQITSMFNQPSKCQKVIFHRLCSSPNLRARASLMMYESQRELVCVQVVYLCVCVCQPAERARGSAEI